MTEGRLLTLLPYGLLTLATVVAVVARPTLGDAAADLPVTLAVAAATAAWMAATGHQSRPVSWVGRTVLAFVLCWLNPFYAIFAFVGLLDVFDALPGRWAYPGVVAVAVTLAGSQSGGFPPVDAAQGVIFGALALLNGGLATIFTRMGERTELRNAELERLNADLGRALAENAALHEQLVAQARRSGALEERQRLAREIHDTIAQDLAGIVTQLEASVGGERHHQVLRLARAALADARRSVLDLSPSDLDDATLAEALTTAVEAWVSERAVRVDVVVTGDPVPLHSEVESTVLRIAQESLNNVAKHARAARVGLTLSYDGDEVVLDVRDDGVGFETDAPARESSFGFRGMRQRAARLDGAFTVESQPGRGTAVSARLPALSREAA